MLALVNLTHLITTYGYAAIFILSVLQSCCIPTSSEITFGFAGFLASEGKLSVPGVIVVGVAGEVVGAYLAWIIGRYFGRALVDRYGRYVLLSHHDLDKAEAWYDRHGNWGVFGGRLIPVIRNFVALTAGVAEVPLVRFGVFTALGSLVWCTAMTLIGYGVGSGYHSIMKGVSYAGYIVAVVIVIGIVVVIYHRYRNYKAATSGGGTQRNVPAHRRTDTVTTGGDADAPASGESRAPEASSPAGDGPVSRRPQP